MKSIVIALIACVICLSPVQVHAQKNPVKKTTKVFRDVVTDIGKTIETVFKTKTRVEKTIEENMPKQGEFAVVNSYGENFITVVELKTSQSEVSDVLAPGEIAKLPAEISPTDKKELVCGFIKVYYFEQYAPSRDKDGNYVCNTDGSHVYGDAIFLGSYPIKDYLTFREPIQQLSAEKNLSRYLRDIKKQSKMYKEQYEAETGEVAQ